LLFFQQPLHALDDFRGPSYDCRAMMRVHASSTLPAPYPATILIVLA
jgi:hypothetical protein